MLKRVLLILMVLGTTFVAAKTIDAIQIRGFDADKLKPIIGIKVGDKYSPSKIEKAKRIIKQALGSAGYNKAKVSSQISNKGKTVGVTFNVNKGNKVTITKINFIGNKKVSSEELSGKLVNKEAEFMGWFPGRSSGTANVPQLRYDALRVQDEYFKRGYLDAKVKTPLIKVDPTTSEATITYKITEGKQYKVSKVALQIPKVVGMNKKALLAHLELKAGEVFDVSKLRNDIKNTTIKLGNLGYAYAKVVPGFRQNRVKRTMSVQYKVVSGPRVTIGDVAIKGNKKTKDRVVRRYVDLAPGDLYNYDKLKESKKALSRTGFFEKAVVRPKKAAGKKVNLEVDVEEAKTGAIAFSGGYGSADGWFVSGSIGSRNMFGTGIEGKASIGYSKVTQSYSISFREPRLFDSKYSVSAGIFKNKSDYSESDTYDNLAYSKKNDLGTYLIFGRQFKNNIYASIGYTYRDVEYSDINQTVNLKDYEDYIKSSIVASFVYDTTDDYYTPREGIYAKLGFEYAGLGDKSVEFMKHSAKFVAYYGLKDQIDYDLIMRFKGRADFIDRVDGKYVPVAERLYLGGASRGIRGFKSGTISPVDSKGYHIGGYRSYAMSLEASIPLSEKSKMRLTFFADYGQMGENSFDITQKSVGAQVEWRSPFGPINLVFAKAIDPDKAHGNTTSFEFSIGGKF